MTLAHDTDRIDGGLIGLCGLSNMALDVNTASGKLPRVWYQRSEVPLATNVTFDQEPGYTFDRNYWGQRFASEAAARVFEYASSTMPVRRIVSVIRPDNTPSFEIARRRGARQENKVMLMGQETGNSGPPVSRLPPFQEVTHLSCVSDDSRYEQPLHFRGRFVFTLIDVKTCEERSSANEMLAWPS